MSKTRVLTGSVLAVGIVLLICFSHIPLVLNAAVACLSIQAIRELYTATKLKENMPIFSMSCVAALWLSFLTLAGFKYLVAIVLVMTVALYAYLMRSVHRQNEIKPWIAVYSAFAFICFLKCMKEIRASEQGIYLFVITILVPVITDIFAYFIGKGCGKHKLAPAISPNKTVEGSIGGTLVAVVVLMTVAASLDAAQILTVRYGALFAYVLSASLVGQFGDIALSSIKRIVGIKDYGTLFPGHGGVLDRFDSLLFVLPFSYLFFQHVQMIAIR